MNVRVKFDSVDRRILNILQKNNRLTNLELSEKAGLSPPTCLKPVRRLRQQKVILADVALLDPRLVAKKLCAFVEVELEQQGEQFQQAFEKKMDRTPIWRDARSTRRHRSLTYAASLVRPGCRECFTKTRRGGSESAASRHWAEPMR